MSLQAEIATYIAAQVPSLTFNPTTVGGNVFVGHLPSSPDTAVYVHGTGGPESSTKSGYDMRTFQVVVRATADPTVGEDLAEEVYAALHGLKNTHLTPGGTLVVLCAGLQSGPVSLGEDENGRHQYSLNFRAEVRNPTSNRSE